MYKVLMFISGKLSYVEKLPDLKSTIKFVADHLRKKQ